MENSVNYFGDNLSLNSSFTTPLYNIQNSNVDIFMETFASIIWN